MHLIILKSRNATQQSDYVNKVAFHGDKSRKHSLYVQCVIINTSDEIVAVGGYFGAKSSSIINYTISTPPIAEILCVKNGRAIVVCGLLMK